MSNPEFLTDNYGVPTETARELLNWALLQEVHVPTRFQGGPFEQSERQYQRARRLIERVKDLGYKRVYE